MAVFGTLSSCFTVKFMRVFLVSNFIWLNPRYRIPGTFVMSAILVIVFIMLFGCVVGFINLNDSADAAPLIFYTTMILQNLGICASIRCHQKELILYMAELQVAGAANWETNRLFKIILKKFLICFYTCYMTMDLLLFVSFATNKEYENNMKYATPFWFYCSNRNASTFISRICWRTDTTVEYLSINVIGCLLIFLMHVPYIMSIAFYLLIMQFKKAHRLQILSKIERVSLLASESYQQNGDRIICRELEGVIRHYQWLHTALKDSLIPLLGKIVGFHLMGSYSIFLSSAFVILHHRQNNILKLIFGGAFLFLVPNFVFFCFAGQYINDLNTRIGVAVYELPWYEQTTEFKKLIYQFLLLLQQPVRIKPFSMYHIRVNFLMHLSRRLYAAVNLIAVRSK